MQRKIIFYLEKKKYFPEKSYFLEFSSFLKQCFLKTRHCHFPTFPHLSGRTRLRVAIKIKSFLLFNWNVASSFHFWSRLLGILKDNKPHSYNFICALPTASTCKTNKLVRENFPNSVLNKRRREKSPKFLLFCFFVPTKQFSQRLQQTNDCPHSEWSFCSLFYARLKVETKFCLLSSKSQFLASYIEKTFFFCSLFRKFFHPNVNICGKSSKTNPHLYG